MKEFLTDFSEGTEFVKKNNDYFEFELELM